MNKAVGGKIIWTGEGIEEFERSIGEKMARTNREEEGSWNWEQWKSIILETAKEKKMVVGYGRASGKSKGKSEPKFSIQWRKTKENM